MILKSATGYAGGKVILLGEHGVVHGVPALAMALSVGVTMTAQKTDGPLTMTVDQWNYQVTSNDSGPGAKAMIALAEALNIKPEAITLTAETSLKARAGMGSSAAIAASAARAMVSLFGLNKTHQELFYAVQASERVFHGNPSGLDAAIALTGGFVEFSKANGVQALLLPIPPFILVYSGQPGDTKQTVAQFARRLKREPEEGNQRLGFIGELVQRGKQALEAGDLRAFGKIMNENHSHLDWFGVSSAKLNDICKIALDAGAMGAKLTGGGGGGCALILAPGNDTVPTKLKKAGFEVVA